MRKQTIVMIGTSLETKGGISSVVNVYRRSGLFNRWPIHYVSTHCDGTQLQKLKIAVKAMAVFIGLLITRRVPLIHVHCASRASFWRKFPFLMIGGMCGISILFHLHGGGFMKFYTQCGAIPRFLIRYVLNHMALIVVLSAQWRSYIQSISDNPNIMTIFNPVQEAVVADRHGSRRRGNTILFMGRLTHKKGAYDLVHAISGLKKQFPGIRALLCGNGDLMEIRRLSEKLNCRESVKILGWVEGGDKTRLYAISDIFVLPSYAEGLPMGVLEAMSAGLPVVATKVGGIPDAVENGKEGFLINPGDTNALIDKLSILLKDDRIRCEMGRAGVNSVKRHFTPKMIMQQIERLYQDLIHKQ